VNYRFIDSDSELVAALDALPGDAALAVDTEFMRRDTYFPRVALLQLCAADEALLIDPLGIEDLEPLRQLFADRSLEKVLHACSEDLEVFRCWLDRQPQPLIDTQRAAALLGEEFGLGYRALVQRLLDVELDKGETRSDWLRRPLSAAQMHYAAQDVQYLVAVWQQLRERAERLGRMAWIVEEGDELLRAMDEREREPFRRIRGAGRLSRAELAVLRALSDWREARARSTDKPRGWVLDDKACVAIARAMPGHRAALAALDVLPAALLRRQGDTLLELVAEARELPESAWPEPTPAPLSPRQRQRLKRLREALRERATALSVAPEILLPAADLELLLRHADGEPVAVPLRWHGWRAAVVVEPLRALLA
jgi:ribonuclease D